MFSYIHPPPAGIKRTNGIIDPHEVEITDLRGISKKEYGLDVSGFGATEHQTCMTYQDWDHDEIIKEKYYPEIEQFLKKETGAHKVVSLASAVFESQNCPDDQYIGTFRLYG